MIDNSGVARNNKAADIKDVWGYVHNGACFESGVKVD